MSEEKQEYITDAQQMIGAGYEQPAAIIDPQRTVTALRDKGLVEYKAWGWVKMSAKFIAHVRILKGAKLAVWSVIALTISENGKCELSVAEIADLAGYSPSETRSTIAELGEMGYMSVESKSGKRNIYSPEFVARAAKTPTDRPLQETCTPTVARKERAVDPSSPPIENSVSTYKELKELKDVSSNSNLQGIEASIYAGRPTTQADIDASNNTGAVWRGRELLPPHYLIYADWWVSKTGLQMYGAKAKAKLDAEWLKACKELWENEVTIKACDEALIACQWKKPSRISQIVAEAKAFTVAPVIISSADLPNMIIGTR